MEKLVRAHLKIIQVDKRMLSSQFSENGLDNIIELDRSIRILRDSTFDILMDQRVTLLKNFYLLTEIVGDIITVKLKFPPPLASLSQKQPLCDNTNLSVFAKYTTKNGKPFEPHRF